MSYETFCNDAKKCTWPIPRSKFVQITPEALTAEHAKEKKNARASQILAEFQDLGRLDSAHVALVLRVKTASPGPTREMFRNFFCSGNIFKSGTGHETRTLSSLDGSDCLGLVTPFTLQEFGTVLRDVHYGKAADADGMVAVVF